ncbi:hypothetical protein FACS1894145_2610 [Bacteroidia bacterium]|nr:hypothetical protein FACS1894145_2610 [Bacteroidia bacterium]
MILLKFWADGSIVENLYYLSGPLLFIIGCFAIIQWMIASNNHIFETTIKLCKIYDSKITKKIKKLDQKIFVKNLYVNNFLFTDFASSDLEKIDEKMQEKYELLYNEEMQQVIELLDNLDLFSNFILHRIVDDNSLYDAKGTTFLENVESISIFLCLIRKEDINMPYQNIVNLYNKWKYYKNLNWQKKGKLRYFIVQYIFL